VANHLIGWNTPTYSCPPKLVVFFVLGMHGRGEAGGLGDEKRASATRNAFAAAMGDGIGVIWHSHTIVTVLPFPVGVLNDIAVGLRTAGARCGFFSWSNHGLNGEFA